MSRSRPMQRGPPQRKHKSILDLNKHLDREVRVKMVGGREVQGTLKGFDQLVNIVLDDATEYLRDPDDQFRLSGESRRLGLVVCKGNSVMLVCPTDGMQEIENPFQQGEEQKAVI